jgi:hypothetical protein
VDYANNAGNADTLDGYHASSLLTSQSTTMSHIATADMEVVGSIHLYWINPYYTAVGTNVSGSTQISRIADSADPPPGTWKVLGHNTYDSDSRNYKISLVKRIS